MSALEDVASLETATASVPIFVTTPSVPILTTAEAKAHLRVEISDDDTLIDAFVSAATKFVERYIARALILRTYDYWLNEWPTNGVLRLPMPPLVSVASVKYYDEDDTEATVPTSDYYVDAKSMPGRLLLRRNASWPNTTLRVANGIVVRYDAGYGSSASDVPEDIRNAIRLLVGHFYENREAVISTGAMPKEMPFAVRALLDPYRMSIIDEL